MGLLAGELIILHTYDDTDTRMSDSSGMGGEKEETGLTLSSNPANSRFHILRAPAAMTSFLSCVTFTSAAEGST